MTETKQEKGLQEIVWDDKNERFVRYKPGRSIKSVIPIGRMSSVNSKGPDLQNKINEYAAQYASLRPNAYELIEAAHDIQPMEYMPIISSYAFRLYRIS